jgi:antitoxin component YwqK of YwqJK toxin-antitoxin module
LNSKIITILLLLGIIAIETDTAYANKSVHVGSNQIVCDSTNVNRVDSVGKKTGLWITMDSGLRSEIYYLHGLKHGIYKVYYRNGELYSIGEYRNDLFSGTNIVFSEEGVLLYKQVDISLNHTGVKAVDSKEIIPKYKSHFISFEVIGEIKEEGTILYDKAVEIESIRYGPWKFYDNGILSKTIDYKDEYLKN